MKQLAIMSDLHLDLNQFGDRETTILKTILQQAQIDHIHFAGDLANDFQHQARPFLNKLAQMFSVTYHFGNHDMTRLNELTIAQQDFQLIPFQNRMLLALHGWYDYSFAEEPHETIERRKALYWYDRRLNRDASDLAITDQIIERLDAQLATLDGSTLIVTLHFVPHRFFCLSHPYFTPFNAFLGSHRFHELFRKHRVHDVVFGHVHRRFGTHVIDGVTYHARPLGYVYEWQLTSQFITQYPHFIHKPTRNPRKRYSQIKHTTEFMHYRQQHLASELRSALTIFSNL